MDKGIFVNSPSCKVMSSIILNCFKIVSYVYLKIRPLFSNKNKIT